MIVEGLLVTENELGQPHLAPMGAVVDEQFNEWTLRPFQTSTTFLLLRRNPNCSFHVVDDVLPVVRAALGLPTEVQFGRFEDPQDAALSVWFLPSACHWYWLQVVNWDVTQSRSEAKAWVRRRNELRPFWGWNRAKHAVLEATILATRLHLADRKLIDEDLKRLYLAVEKTGGPREFQAWSLLDEYFATH